MNVFYSQREPSICYLVKFLICLIYAKNIILGNKKLYILAIYEGIHFMSYNEYCVYKIGTCFKW